MAEDEPDAIERRGLQSIHGAGRPVEQRAQKRHVQQESRNGDLDRDGRRDEAGGVTSRQIRSLKAQARSGMIASPASP